MLQSMTSGDKAFAVFSICVAAVVIIAIVSSTVSDVMIAKYKNKNRD